MPSVTIKADLKDLLSCYLPRKTVLKNNENVLHSRHAFLPIQGKEGAFMVRNSSQAGMYTVSLFSKAMK